MSKEGIGGKNAGRIQKGPAFTLSGYNYCTGAEVGSAGREPSQRRKQGRAHQKKRFIVGWAGIP